MTLEQYKEIALKYKVEMWNTFCEKTNCNLYLYKNDQETINEIYRHNTYKLAEDIYYGNYDYNDLYICYDELGLLNSFSDQDELHAFIDVEHMLTWFNKVFISIIEEGKFL
jgi:hypothetical protein